jgi:methionine sulfoxide reductase heme-binding subunit
LDGEGGAAGPPFVRTRAAVFVGALLPALIFLDRYVDGAFARPWKALIQESGDWSMRFLIVSVCITPLVAMTGQAGLNSFRRMIGLFGAAYAGLHLFAWTREYGYDWPFLAAELIARQYLMVGGFAVALLIPLAATSPGLMHRALGDVAWRRLHGLTYPMVVAAFLHYALAGNARRPEVMVDGALLVWALAVRVWRWRRPAAGLS